MKLRSKERQEGKVIKKYDAARTPYQRVLASEEVSEEVKEALRQQFHELDPVGLLGKLTQLRNELRQYADVSAHPLNEGDQLPMIEAPSPSNLAVAAGQCVVAVGRSMVGGDGACRPVTVTVAPPSAQPAKPLRSPRSEHMTKKTKRKGRYHLVKHTWRTHPDTFAGVWAEVEEQLRSHPHREAKGLFRDLQDRHRGQFKDGQLRTFQRRVKAWRIRQAAFVAEQIGLVMAGESGDGLAVHGPLEVEVMLAVAAEAPGRSSYVSQELVRLGGLCTGEQVFDLPTCAQRYYEAARERLSLSYVATTGIPRWSG